ncbi:MAG: Ni/Fe hydrogenase subunit alpha [Bacteroidetes bacterium]|nr:MAG: Ni/Fe hydrogenase subunit alpha [Bacteroidota bacterium]
MKNKIVIDPVTRVEGHGKVTINLDDKGKVKDSFFHIVEFRGFEKFIQGHGYWAVPVIVQRLCGICPVSHHLAAAKAIDQIVGIDPEDLSPTASKLRKLLHYGQVFQSHALHFFYLAAPDLLFGVNAPVEKRNVVAVATEHKELARQGILMRKFGQEMIRAIAGKKIHGISAVPGGVHKNLSTAERDYFLNGKEIPSVDTMIEWSTASIDFLKEFHQANQGWMDSFATYDTGHLGLVGKDGSMELYDGNLRGIDARGNITLNDVPDFQYADYFAEAVKPWSYMKFPYIKHLGEDKGWNRVGPLARLNVCNKINTPLAERERQEFMAYTGNKPNNMTMHTHMARLIEVLHCAEVMKELLHDEDIMGDELVRKGVQREHGVGVIEAPRGTLIHDYEVDKSGKVRKCNLIVSTTHNNAAMNEAVSWVAKKIFDKKQKVTDEMLNEIEVAIRAYDPCLSCATHAMGQMPLHVEIFDSTGNKIDEKFKS